MKMKIQYCTMYRQPSIHQVHLGGSNGKAILVSSSPIQAIVLN